jgi:hypothetical protein
MIRWGSEGRRLPARLLAIDDTCWFCHASVRAIAGVLVDPALTADRSGFVPLDDVAGVLVAALDTRAMGRHGIGELRHRASPGVQGGYVGNGCRRATRSSADSASRISSRTTWQRAGRSTSWRSASRSTC